MNKIVQKSIIYVYLNDYKGYLVPKRLKLIIFTEKLNSIQEITVINNYTVLLGLLFWPRWYAVKLIVLSGKFLFVSSKG